MKLFVPVILGTTRPERRSIAPAHFVKNLLSAQDGVVTELVDPENFDLPHDGRGKKEKDPYYSQLTKRADAFVIITPEYNHSIPGSLKRLLDSELESYHYKPALLGGVSSGPWGGARALEHLAGISRTLGMFLPRYDLHFPDIDSKLDLHNTYSPADEEQQLIINTLSNFLSFARILRPIRSKLEQST